MAFTLFKTLGTGFGNLTKAATQGGGLFNNALSNLQGAAYNITHPSILIPPKTTLTGPYSIGNQISRVLNPQRTIYPYSLVQPQGSFQINIPGREASQESTTPPTPVNVDDITQRIKDAAGTGGGLGGISPELLGTENVFNPYEYDFEKMFAPAYEAFTQQEAAARGLEQAQQEAIAAGKQEAEDIVKANQAEQKASLEETKKQSYQQEEKGVSEAARTASEIGQSNIAKFGGGSSAGLAASDILGQATLRTIGDIRQNALNIRDQVLSEGRRLENFVADQLKNISNQAQAATQQAKAELQQTLSNIAANRGQLGVQANQMFYQAVNTYKDKLLQIDQYNNQLKNQVAQFNANMQAQLSSAVQTAQDKSLDIFEKLSPALGYKNAAYAAGLVDNEEQAKFYPEGYPSNVYQKVSGIFGGQSLFNPTTGKLFGSNIFGNISGGS